VEAVVRPEAMAAVVEVAAAAEERVAVPAVAPDLRAGPPVTGA